jgi:ribose 5-phosphate isomerase B
MRIGVGADHAGYLYKEAIKALLLRLGHDVRDFGTHGEAPVDYPPIARAVAEAVAAGDVERGIVLGGSGNGEAMAANRVPGARCALVWSVESARLARAHNDANVLALGQRLLPQDVALDLVRIWLNTPFDDGRHAERIRQLDRPTRRPPAPRRAGAARTTPRPRRPRARGPRAPRRGARRPERS